MNFIICDKETGIPLYGIVLLKEIKRSGRSAQARTYNVPAEAWIAFLQTRYSSVPEVRAYLRAVENGEGINPKEGLMLEAIDQSIEVPEAEFRYGMSLCGPEAKEWLGDDQEEEGEEWKQK